MREPIYHFSCGCEVLKSEIVKRRSKGSTNWACPEHKKTSVLVSKTCFCKYCGEIIPPGDKGVSGDNRSVCDECKPIVREKGGC